MQDYVLHVKAEGYHVAKWRQRGVCAFWNQANSSATAGNCR